MQPYSRRRLIVAIVVLTLLAGLILYGVYLWRNLVFTGERRDIPGTPHHFIIQPGVSEADLDLVTQGLVLSEDYFISQLGQALPNPIEVRMGRTTPCNPFQSLYKGSTANADKNMICVNTLGYTWTEVVPDEPLIGLSVIAHEHFHNFQGQLGCLPRFDEHEYNWWVEGSATYVGWHALVEADFVTEADVLETMHDWGGFSNDLEPLEIYEDHMTGDPSYALAYRAIADLVKRTGTEASLYDFCQKVGTGQDWRTAFQDVYGVSIEDFYTQFEQER